MKSNYMTDIKSIEDDDHEFEKSTVKKEAEIAAVSRNYQSAIHEGAIKIFQRRLMSHLYKWH